MAVSNAPWTTSLKLCLPATGQSMRNCKCPIFPRVVRAVHSVPNIGQQHRQKQCNFFFGQMSVPDVLFAVLRGGKRCAHSRATTRTTVHLNVYIYIYIYMYVCIYMYATPFNV